MKYDIVIAGVGGQGILTIAAVLGRAVLTQGWRLKQSEVHGMAQRGGAVQAHFRMADDVVHSDLIARGQADLLLAMEPMEALRHRDWLSAEGWIVSHREPVANIPNYPDQQTLLDRLQTWPKHVLLDGVTLAREAGGPPQALNMALLGAAASLLPLSREQIEQAVGDHFRTKGERMIEVNLAVLRAAREWADAQRRDQERADSRS